MRVALAGLGRWGPNLARVLHAHPEVTLAWLVDEAPDRLSAVAARFPSARTSTRLADALHDVDACVIATPATTHHALAALALQAGRHVLVEKPLVPTVADAEALTSLASRLGRHLMVGHTYQFHPAFEAMTAALDSLGTLQLVRATRVAPGPVRTDVSAVFDLLAHDVGLLQHWFGQPHRVRASGTPTRDAVQASLGFSNGATALLEATWLAPVKSRRLELVGTQASLVFDELSAEPLRRFTASGVEVLPLPPGEPLALEVAHFVDVVKGRTSCRTTGEFATDVVRTLAAIEAGCAE